MPRETRTLGGGSSNEARVGVGRRIDLDLRAADIRDVCRLLADAGHVNIVVGDGVTGPVTVKMKNVPWDSALEAILRAKGLHSERDGNIIMVLGADPSRATP